MALARLHRERTETAVQIRLPKTLPPAQARALLRGAGFAPRRGDRPGEYRARRELTLPDFVRPGLELLICGLNPSLYSARAGVPFARPGNRFWPAALRCGLLTEDRDVFAAIARGVGFVDLVKRATRQARELTAGEFTRGLRRLERLLREQRPGALCMVGLQGWRSAVRADARPGWQTPELAGVPVYLMPSTSGLNAHIDVAGLAEHLSRARRPDAARAREPEPDPQRC